MSNGPIKNVQWIDDGRKVALVEAAGDIDLQHSTEFQQKLLELPAQHPGLVIVDLSGVPYMDSSGVASLVKLLARLRREGILLRLAGLTPRVRSVFEITRLNTVFEIYPTAQEAMKA